jgi:hypothetical protein
MTNGILTQIARFQSRARAVLIVRSLLVAATLSLALAAGGIAMAPVSGNGGWMVIGVAAVTAVAGAVAVGWWRTPGAMVVARQIDTCLDLQDRVTAAVQLADDDDLISRLVARDAVRRIAPVDPAHVFPLRVDWRVAPPLVALSVAMLVATMDVSPETRLESPSGAAAGAVAIGPSRQGSAPLSPEPDATTQPEMRGAPATGASPTREHDPSSAASSVAAAGPERSTQPRSERQGPKPGDVVDRRAATAPSPEPHESSDASGPGTGAGTANRDANGRSISAAGVRDATSAGAPAMAGGGAATSTAAQRPGSMSSAAGGVGGDAAAMMSPRHDQPGAPRESTAGVAQIARARAESVTTRDDIPPGRRQYVREYFLRLQRSGTPK